MAATGVPFYIPAVAANGTVASSFKVNGWIPTSAGAPTATRRTFYTDAELTTPASNPATLGASGRVFYINPVLSYAFTITDAAEAVTYDTVHIPAGLDGTASVNPLVMATYATMTALTAGSGLVDNGVYYTYARTTEEDGGAAFWRYDSASTTTANGIDILAIDGGGAGRFFRLTGDATNYFVGMSSSSVPLCNAGARISGQWTFDTPPAFRDRLHTRAALDLFNGSTVPGGQFYSSLQVFQAGIQVFSDLNFESTDAGALGPVSRLYHNSASPAANDIIGLHNFQGKDSGGNQTSYADIRAIIEDPTNGSEDGNLTFFATVAGTAAAQLQIGNGVYGPGATGGYKGSGTANFTAVYDDNTLLSCYVFDAAMDGAVSMAKWDTKVPNRKHAAQYAIDERPDPDNPEKTIRLKRMVKAARVEERQHDEARKFAARLGGEYDPLDIEGYSRHWQEKRHLTSMPNEDKFDPEAGMPSGAWVQRLIETVEIQAVHIWKLHERLKQLEQQSRSSADAGEK